MLSFSPRIRFSLSWSACARSPMVLIFASAKRLADAPPTNSSSPTGSGHIFCGISSGNSVCTLSGFSKSLAILAQSLFRPIPIFTVKPSSSRIRSLISWARAIGFGYMCSVPVKSRKHSSMENSSTAGA